MALVELTEEAPSLVRSLKVLEDVLDQTFKSLDKPKEESAKMDKPTPPCAIRAEKVNVYVRVVFLKLGEVDTVNEKFMADVFVQAHWKEPALDKATGPADGSDLPNWSSYWNPKLFVENGLGDLKETIWYSVSYNDLGKATIFQRRRIKGTFFEKMELMEYPFDTQDLTVMLSSERGDHEVELMSDPIEVSSINVTSFVDEQEWELHKHVHTWTRVMSSIFTNMKKRNPAIATSCRVSRRSRFFMWNIVIIMIFISSLTFTSWTVDQHKVQRRLQLSFILLLSNITFKFTVSKTLPKVSYLTILDKYIIYSMAQLCLVCVWHAIAATILHYDPATADAADQMALYIQGVLYIIFNMCFFMHGRYITYRRLKELEKKDRRHQAKLDAMEEILTKRDAQKPKQAKI